MKLFWCFFALLCLLLSCKKSPAPGVLFRAVPRSHTNIDFRNLLIEKETFNIFKYQYFYNGGGTAVGDFNNDGLMDLVFTGNMVKNRLYLNEGNFEFKDATQDSGIADHEGWCTGATPIDINQDGWLDLYICRAGYPFEHLRSNLLFINQGGSGKSVQFVEKSADYGLGDLGHSTQASFFDYDKDGDLDLFLINHSTVEYSRGSLDIYQIKGKKNPEFANKLFRNDGTTFSNVTEAAGITANVLTFSLGVNTCDINQDGWPDIFVSNDFNEPDYLFINQKNGIFKEELRERFDHTSLFSMGCDVADFNGDALPDLVSLDMLPESNHLQKMHSGADNFEKVYTMIRNGFYKQYSRNMLQLNNGDGTFSEIGQMTGVSNTDWSWSSLFFDFDNDGARDLFVSNGYPRDHTNMDFLKFTADEVVRMQKGEQNIGFQEYLQKMPPIMEPNYFFKNDGNLSFSNQTEQWGMNKPVVTQSAAWADLDNDGDLDLVLNNTNEYADIIENHADKNPDNHWLRLQLMGQQANPQGIGAKVWAYAGERVFYLEQNPVRGFQSSVDPILSLGLGNTTQLDSLVLVWPTDEKQVLTHIPTNQTLTLKITEAVARWSPEVHTSNPVFSEMAPGMPFQHQENEHNDLKKQSLMPWFYSRQGPALALADVNGDGLDDAFWGGAQGFSGQLLLQKKDGSFTPVDQPAFKTDARCEDTDAAFFDADADGDLDLYVCSGGYEWEQNATDLQDRLYRNDGHGHFTKAPQCLPDLRQPSTCVRPADADGDGDQDLFVGGGIMPTQYPKSAASRLLVNDGKGQFLLGAEFPGATDAVWMDVDQDRDVDLIAVGEWASVQIFENIQGTFTDQTNKHFPAHTTGMWYAIHAADLDGDGDSDLVVGNLGNNTQIHASEKEPINLWYDDFDRNGSIDPLLFYYVQGKSFPLASMEDLTNQLPYLRKKFNYFKDYADAQVADILTAAQIKAASHAEATSVETIWLENDQGVFHKKTLPVIAQIAPVQAIATLDANGDGHPDIVLAGNRTHARVKLGSMDGNHGQLFLGDGKGGFTYVPQFQSGLNVRGDVRAIRTTTVGGKLGLVFGINNEKPAVYKLNHEKNTQ